jgi:hypothetical protein
MGVVNIRLCLNQGHVCFRGNYSCEVMMNHRDEVCNHLSVFKVLADLLLEEK